MPASAVSMSAAVAVPNSTPRSRGDADQELASLCREHTELKLSTKVLHSVILALVQENQRLARRRRRDNADRGALSTSDATPSGSQ